MVLEMFNIKTNHICTVEEKTSMSVLPPLSENAGFLERSCRSFKKLILITERNPRTTEFYRSYDEILQTRRKQIKSGSSIIHPFSYLRAFYEMWLIAFYSICLIYMPLRAAFKLQIHVYVDRILFLVCVVDIVMNFVTGYVDHAKKLIVMDSELVAKHYLLSVHFVADVLSSVPYVVTKENKIIWFFSFLKITRLHSLYFYVDCTAEFLSTKTIVFRILKFPVLSVLIIHWFACIQFALPSIRWVVTDRYDPQSWLNTQHVLENTTAVQYVHSIYKASSELLCIFSGIKTSVWEERLFAVATSVFGRLFFLFMCVTLMNLLMDRRALETKYSETISQLRAYMKHRKLPRELQQKMLQYYRYKYRNKFFKETVITGLLSDKLKKEINVDKCRKLVETVSLFRTLSGKTLEDVLSQLRTEIYLPNDIIIRAGTIGDCMYFLASGTVCVSTPLGKEVCHLQDGAYFGEMALMMKGRKRTANIVAIEICEVYTLERKPFKYAFCKDPVIFQQIDEVVQERLEVTKEIDRLQQLIIKADERRQSHHD